MQTLGDAAHRVPAIFDAHPLEIFFQKSSKIFAIMLKIISIFRP